MRVGQTSVILFISKVLTSLLGFVSVVYFARVLGASNLGIYFLALTVISWFHLFGTIGYRLPGKKRISETDTEQAEFITASLIITSLSFIILLIFLVVFRDWVNSYIGMSVTNYIIFVIFVILFYRLLMVILQGQDRVHIYAGVRAVRKFSEVLFQVGIVILGFGVVGLLAGYAAGMLVAFLCGIYFISVDVARPSRRHFQSLYSYAKYSWLQSFQGRTFSYMDVLVLGFFVSSDFIGIYQISWQIASFLVIFASSISQTLFPKISEISEGENEQYIVSLFTDSLSYSGIFIIPGFIGGVILGDDILRIYGTEFSAGEMVLSILLFSRLIYVYQSQIVSTINAINRPKIGFKINLVFVVSNIGLNVILVWQIGWIGAAIATTISAAISLALGLHYITDIIPVQWPIKEISLQWLAALVMAVFILVLSRLQSISGYSISPTVDVVVLVVLGAAVYFNCVYLLSPDLRSTVKANI